MKKIILLMLVILMFACENNNIEIITNYDDEYHEVTAYERIIQNLIATETKTQMNKEINEIFSKTKCVTENKPENYSYELFIGKNGEIEKIEIPSILEGTENISMLEKMKNWKFGKYVTDGNAEKYRLAVTVMKLTSRGRTFATTIGNGGTVIDEKVFFVAVEEMPSPIGGIKAIQEKIKYPEIAKRAGIQGRVFVKAFIDSTGTVAKAEILKGIGAGCDEVAIEAVKKVKFIPGKQRGKVVNVQVTVPILFKLDDSVSEVKKPKANDEMLLKESKDENQKGMAKVSGKVVLQNGTPLVAASIILEGTKRGGSSNHMGEFFISKIEPGEYKVMVTSSTYGNRSLGKIKLRANKTSIVELKIAGKN